MPGLWFSCPSGVRILYDLGSDGIEVTTAGFHSLPTLTWTYFVPVEGHAVNCLACLS